MKKAFGLGVLFSILLFLIAYTKLSLILALLCAVAGGIILGGGIGIYNAQHKQK